MALINEYVKDLNMKHEYVNKPFVCVLTYTWSKALRYELLWSLMNYE